MVKRNFRKKQLKNLGLLIFSLCIFIKYSLAVELTPTCANNSFNNPREDDIGLSTYQVQRTQLSCQAYEISRTRLGGSGGGALKKLLVPIDGQWHDAQVLNADTIRAYWDSTRTILTEEKQWQRLGLIQTSQFFRDRIKNSMNIKVVQVRNSQHQERSSLGINSHLRNCQQYSHVCEYFEPSITYQINNSCQALARVVNGAVQNFAITSVPSVTDVLPDGWYWGPAQSSLVSFEHFTVQDRQIFVRQDFTLKDEFVVSNKMTKSSREYNISL